MRGVSREAAAALHDYLDQVLAAGADPVSLGGELFAVADLLADNVTLRRALTDPSRPADVRVALMERLLEGKVGAPAFKVAGALARVRWAAIGDITTAAESLAASAILEAAERAGRLDQVEDELFRFSRLVVGDPELREALSERTPGAQRKVELVERLLGGHAAPETVVLEEQAVAHPHGQRTEAVLESYILAAAERRERMRARVVSAVPLSEAQRDRLARALSASYGKPVQLSTEVDPSVIGGMRVQVGGDLIDSTILSRLDEAKRGLVG